MSRRKRSPEEIIGKLREAEVSLAQGKKVPEVCRTLGGSEQSYCLYGRLSHCKTA